MNCTITGEENNTQIDCVLFTDDVSMNKISHMLRLKFPIIRIFCQLRIALFVKIMERHHFVNLVIERPS